MPWLSFGFTPERLSSDRWPAVPGDGSGRPCGVSRFHGSVAGRTRQLRRGVMASRPTRRGPAQIGRISTPTNVASRPARISRHTRQSTQRQGITNFTRQVAEISMQIMRLQIKQSPLILISCWRSRLTTLLIGSGRTTLGGLSRRGPIKHQ